MKDKVVHFGKFYIRLQLRKPFLVKKWCFVNRGSKGFNLHLCPLHIHYEKEETSTLAYPIFNIKLTFLKIKLIIAIRNKDRRNQVFRLEKLKLIESFLLNTEK